MSEDMRVVFRGEFDTADIKKGARETDQTLSGLANKVKGLAIGAVIAKGFQLAYKACMESVDAFKEAQVAVTKFDTIAKTIGFSNQQIMNLKDYAGEVQNLTGMSDEAILGAEQLLLATNALDEEGIKKATLSCADLAVAMGTDITSSAQALAIALQSPTDGLTRLRRSGILFTDEEEALVKSLDEAGEKAKAQEVILSKIQSRYEGVAKAVGDTDVGTLSKISETWGDIKENLGETILESVRPALTALLEALTAVKEWMRQYREGKQSGTIIDAITDGRSLDDFTTETIQNELQKQKAVFERAQSWFYIDGAINEKTFKQYEDTWLKYGGALAEEMQKRLDEQKLPEMTVESVVTTTVSKSATKAYQDFDAQLNDLRDTYNHYKSERDKAEEGTAKWLYYNQLATEAQEEYQEMINQTTYAVKEDTSALDDLTSLLASYSDTYKESALNEQIAQLEEYGKTFPQYATEIEEAIAKINEQLNPSEEEPVILTALEQLQKTFSEIENGEWASVGFNAFAEGIDALGQALAGNEDAWSSWAKSVLNSIASVIMSHGYEMLAEGTLKLFNTATMAEGLAEVAKSAGVIALGGLVKGLGSRFERGGIVGGSGITGDRHMIFANAGELILNRSQQMAIASQLNQRASGNITVTFNGTVLGDQESISSWVYDGIQRARSSGIV